MNLQESIRRILREEKDYIKLPLFIRRRSSIEDLDDLIVDIKNLIDNGWSKTDAIYASVEDFMMKGPFNFGGETEDEYWESVEKFETPLVNYVKLKLE
jgi:hypothetical protein